MPAPLGKILVIRGGAIGDFVLTLPALTALRETFPQVHIELLGYPHIAQLALAGGLVNHVRSIEARALASFFAKGGSLPKEMAEYFEQFALIISYLYDPDQIFRENVARCSKAQFILGPHRPNESSQVHATEAFLRPLERLAIFGPDPVPRLKLTHEDAPKLSQDTATAPSSEADRWLAVHPGSGSERKNWPEENWSRLLSQLSANTHLRFLLVGGEAEGARLTRLSSVIPSDRLKVAQSLPLRELASLLGQCGAYLGHDSGISHLAAALGLEGVILWGHTKEKVWRPRSERMTLLHSPGGLATLRVEEVLAAVEGRLLG